MRILDLGCGWGSLSLWLAERYPAASVVGVSNSAVQREWIEAAAVRRGLPNLRVVTADVNEFSPDGCFDRVLSIEMFEHMRNWSELSVRVAAWLEPGGDGARVFVHVFSHRRSGGGRPVECAGDSLRADARRVAGEPRRAARRGAGGAARVGAVCARGAAAGSREILLAWQADSPKTPYERRDSRRRGPAPRLPPQQAVDVRRYQAELLSLPRARPAAAEAATERIPRCAGCSPRNRAAAHRCPSPAARPRSRG